DDYRDLVGERRIVRDDVRHRVREEVAVAVLMLQSLAGERRAAGGPAEEEAARPRIGSSPNEVADALETEHRIEDENRDRVDAVRRIRGPRGDERRHRARLGDAFLEDLAVGRLLVIEERVHVDGLIELAG